MRNDDGWLLLSDPETGQELLRQETLEGVRDAGINNRGRSRDESLMNQSTNLGRNLSLEQAALAKTQVSGHARNNM